MAQLLAILADQIDSVEVPQTEPTLGRGVAVLHIDGRLTQQSYARAVESFGYLMADPSVGGVVLEINSPGGDVAGCFEAVRQMRALKSKPVVAHARDLAASAAYALATVADSIYLPETGTVGSVGVLAVHQEVSKALDAAGVTTTIIRSGDQKADANALEPLTDAAKATVQRGVDMAATAFFGLVAQSRGIDAGALNGAVFHGSDAVSVGLADGIASFDEVIEMTIEKSAWAKLVAAMPDIAEMSADEAVGALTAWRAAAGKVEALSTRVAEAEAVEAQRKLDAENAERSEMLRAAVVAGRVSPAEAFVDGKMAADFAAMPIEMLKAHIEKRPVMAGQVKAPTARVTDEPVTLSEAEERYVRSTGTDVELYKKLKMRASSPKGG